MKKKNNNKNLPNLRDRDDIARLKRIARRMVGHIEQAIDDVELNESASESGKNEWIYSGKNSLVGTLITLTDLLIKLEASGKPEAVASKADELDILPLSKPDKQLLRLFIEKQQQSAPDAE